MPDRNHYMSCWRARSIGGKAFGQHRGEVWRACRFLVEEGDAEVAEADLRSGRGLGLGEGGTRLSPPEDDVDVGEAEPAAAASAASLSSVSMITNQCSSPPTQQERQHRRHWMHFFPLLHTQFLPLLLSEKRSALVFFTVACAAAAALHNHYSERTGERERERSRSCSSSGNTDGDSLLARSLARCLLHSTPLRSARNN